MRITSKGQVTIPQAIRERAGLMPGAEVEFSLDGGVVRIARMRMPKGPTRGERLVAALRGAGDVRMTTDEIMALTRGLDRHQGRGRRRARAQKHERRPRR